MAVKESPRTFRASDGREFSSKRDAERYEMLLQAKRVHDNAKAVLCRALAETQKTADGVPFEFGVFKDYYYIMEWDGFPHLRQVDFVCMHGADDFVLHADGTISLVDTRAEGRRREHRISELYCARQAALKALIDVREKRLAELAADTKKMKAELKKDE
jgi:hypothetical protein